MPLHLTTLSKWASSQHPVPQPLLEPEKCSQLGICSSLFLALAGVDCCQEDRVSGNPAALATEDQSYVLGAAMSASSAFQNPMQGCGWAEPEGPGYWQVQHGSLDVEGGDGLWCGGSVSVSGARSIWLLSTLSQGPAAFWEPGGGSERRRGGSWQLGLGRGEGSKGPSPKTID